MDSLTSVRACEWFHGIKSQISAFYSIRYQPLLIRLLDILSKSKGWMLENLTSISSETPSQIIIPGNPGLLKPLRFSSLAQLRIFLRLFRFLMWWNQIAFLPRLFCVSCPYLDGLPSCITNFGFQCQAKILNIARSEIGFTKRKVLLVYNSKSCKLCQDSSQRQKMSYGTIFKGIEVNQGYNAKSAKVSNYPFQVSLTSYGTFNIAGAQARREVGTFFFTSFGQSNIPKMLGVNLVPVTPS